MRLFLNNEKKAHKSMMEKKTYWMNSVCPFNTHKLCGSWCGLFYVGQVGEASKPYVILGCKGSNTKLYVDEVIED